MRRLLLAAAGAMLIGSASFKPVLAQGNPRALHESSQPNPQFSQAERDASGGWLQRLLGGSADRQEARNAKAPGPVGQRVAR